MEYKYGNCISWLFHHGFDIKYYLSIRLVSVLVHIYGGSYSKLDNFPGGAVVKNLPTNAGDARHVGSIPGLGRSPGGGNGNPLPSSCLGNPVDRGAWQATVRGVTKSRT